MHDPQQKNRIGFDILKLMEWAVSIVFILIIILLVIGFFPLSHSVITQYTHSLIKESRPDSCRVGKVTLTPWKGITLYDVSVAGTADEDIAYQLQLSKVRISCNVIRTALKWSQIKESFQDFRKVFSETIQNNPGYAVDTLLKLAVHDEDIKSVLIDGKGIKLFKGKTQLIAADRFSFDIIRDKENPQNIELALEAAEFHYLTNIITFMRTSAVFDNRTLNINKCRGRVLDGKLKLSTEINLQSGHLLDLSLSASNLDIEQMMVSLGTMYGCAYGKIDFDLDLEPSVLVSDSIRGKGTIYASNVRIEESPIQKSLDELFDIQKFIELSFTKVRADFEIIAKDSFDTDISGNGEMLDFKSKGQISLDGMINQHIEAALSDDVLNGFPSEIANSLELNEDKRRTIRCRVYGTLSNPKVELDRDILKKTIGNVFEQMKENFKDFFRKK